MDLEFFIISVLKENLVPEPAERFIGIIVHLLPQQDQQMILSLQFSRDLSFLSNQKSSEDLKNKNIHQSVFLRWTE